MTVLTKDVTFGPPFENIQIFDCTISFCDNGSFVLHFLIENATNYIPESYVSKGYNEISLFLTMYSPTILNIDTNMLRAEYFETSRLSIHEESDHVVAEISFHDGRSIASLKAASAILSEPEYIISTKEI